MKLFNLYNNSIKHNIAINMNKQRPIQQPAIYYVIKTLVPEKLKFFKMIKTKEKFKLEQIQKN